MSYSYKVYSDTAEVEEMLTRAEDGEYSSKSTMYSILVQIINDWKGTYYAERALYLIITEFSEYLRD